MKTLTILLLLLIASCAPQQQKELQNIDAHRTKELLDNKEKTGLFVLNVHTPYEGKLEKTDAIIEDWENIAAHTDKLPKDKNTPLLVYCRTGRMSTSATKQLQDIGYTKIYHLNGGMKAWDAAGYTITAKTFK